MRTIRRCGIICLLGLLGFAETSHAQIVLGLDVVRGDEPSEVAVHVGLSSYRHLVAVEYSKLSHKVGGSGCSLAARYEFTPRKVYDQTTERIRRVSAFAVGSTAIVGDSCTYNASDGDAPATGLGRYFNARADVGGGVRILLFEGSEGLWRPPSGCRDFAPLVWDEGKPRSDRTRSFGRLRPTHKRLFRKGRLTLDVAELPRAYTAGLGG